LKTEQIKMKLLSRLLLENTLKVIVRFFAEKKMRLPDASASQVMIASMADKEHSTRLAALASDASLESLGPAAWIAWRKWMDSASR